MDCFYSGMKKSLTALAFGTLGLGIAEFVMMGILPDVAKDLHISIPQAGHFISAYALGVCVGAPGMVLVARTRPLKHILLGLMVIYICGNLCAAASVNYWMMLMMRFISGLPHGAFFGVGSIVAERVADKGKSSQAVALMVSGMTIANLFGVPLGTFMSNIMSWRIPFLFNGVWGLIIFVTALREYVFEGYDVGAFHYLLKPIDEQKFTEVMDRAICQIRSKKNVEPLVIKVGGNYVRIPVDDILYAENQARKIMLHTKSKKEPYCFYEKMEVLEQKLGDRFFRSHRGFLVNLQEVARYDNSNIELKNGESVFLAKQKYNDFVTAYMKYLRKV